MSTRSICTSPPSVSCGRAPCPDPPSSPCPTSRKSDTRILHPLDLFNRQWHFRASMNLAEAVITLSDYSKRTIVEHYGISPAKLFVSHVAVDDRYLRAADVARRPRQPLPASFIFYPANRWQHKNHDGILQALKILRERDGLSVDAVFTGHDVGNGYRLTAMAERYRVADLVHDVGFLSVEELAFVYRQARLLRLPVPLRGFRHPAGRGDDHRLPHRCVGPHQHSGDGRRGGHLLRPDVLPGTSRRRSSAPGATPT